MVEFFRSAMSYLSGEGEGGGSGSGGGSAFVGQTVDVGEGMKLKVKKVVAEGKEDPLPLNTPPYPLHLSPFLPLNTPPYPLLSLSLLGGYGFVFIAQDISTGIDYALKVSLGVSVLPLLKLILHTNSNQLLYLCCVQQLWFILVVWLYKVQYMYMYWWFL